MSTPASASAAAVAVTAETNTGAMDDTVIGKGKVGTHEFMMYQYKITLCPCTESHVWEQCLYAHRGERARRRHPCKYQAVQCPEARAKKACPRGDNCNCTHHLFEYWLHPDRYMTCLCELGLSCNRPICFFAHHPSELRPLPDGLAHPEEDAFPARRRERHQRGSHTSSAGNSGDPLDMAKGPGTSSSSACFPAPSVNPGQSAVVAFNSPEIAGLSDAFGALDMLSPRGSAAMASNAPTAALMPASVAADPPPMQPLQLQQRLSTGSEPSGLSLQPAYFDTGGAAAASQRRASSAPSLVSSSLYSVLTQQQQQYAAVQQLQQQQQQQWMLGPVSRQGSGGAQSACSTHSFTMLPVLTAGRTLSPGLDMQPVRASLQMPAGIAGSSLSSGGLLQAEAAQLQQQQVALQLRTQSRGRSLSAMSSVSLPGSNCSSPLGFSGPQPSPVTSNHTALGMLNSGMTGSLNPSALRGLNTTQQAQTSGMLDAGFGLAQQQQQQQRGATSVVMLAPRGVQQLRGAGQMLPQMDGGLAYMQTAGQTAVLLQQQMVPVQQADDPNLSFSMWGPDDSYLMQPHQCMAQQQHQYMVQPQQYMQQQPANNWQQQAIQQQQQQQVTLLPLNGCPSGGGAADFQGWQQQQQQQLNHMLQMQQQQPHLPDSRHSGAWN